MRGENPLLIALRWLAVLPGAFLAGLLASLLAGLVVGIVLSFLPLSQGTLQVVVEMVAIPASLRAVLTATALIAPSGRGIAALVMVALFVVLQLSGMAMSHSFHPLSLIVLALAALHGAASSLVLARREREA